MKFFILFYLVVIFPNNFAYSFSELDTLKETTPLQDEGFVVSVVEAFLKEWNEGTPDDQFTAPEFKLNYKGKTYKMTLEEGYKLITEWRKAIPDIHVTAEQVVADKDKLVILYRFTGTLTNNFPLLNLKASGKHFNFEQVSIFRFEGKNVVECWEVWDQYGFLKQVAN